MTIIVLLLSIALAAGVLHWWSARSDTSVADGPPPLFYTLDPSAPVGHLNGNGGSPLVSHLNGNGASPLASHLNGNGASPPSGHLNGNAASPLSHLNGNGARPRATDSHPVHPFVVEPPPMNHRAPVRPLDIEHGNGKAKHDSADTEREHSETKHDNAETVRFVRPSDLDLAVQLLPGRLEVLEGTTEHREIRFMRVPGEPAHVILGREVRFSPHYVGLGSPTVSRRHARFDFVDSHWTVTNLSRTNPLIVNDDELFDTDVARLLVDGDRLELGDVVLRFHAH